MRKPTRSQRAVLPGSALVRAVLATCAVVAAMLLGGSASAAPGRLTASNGDRAGVSADAAVPVATGTRARPSARSLGAAAAPAKGATAYRLGGQAGRDPGDHFFYYLPVYWTSTPPSSDPTEGVSEAVDAADAYFDEATNGAVRLHLGFAEGWNRIYLSSTESATCDRTAIYREASKLIEGGGDRFDHVMIQLPGYSACDWSDLEYSGTTSAGYGLTMINGSVNNTWVAEWALLFNNNVTSTGSLDCVDGSTPVPLSSNCTVADWNNPWDPASGRPYGKVGSPLSSTLWDLGVLSESDIPGIAVGAPQTLTVQRLGAGSGLRGFYFDIAGYRYYVDYRATVGLDSWIDDATYASATGTRTDPGGGVTVHRQSLTDKTYARLVLDFHPEDRSVNDTQRHPGLDAGESYTSPDGYWKLSVTAETASSATIAVSFPALQKVQRWSGSDRYAASAAISARSFDPGVAVAYVASGNVYTDALSGAPVAGMTQGPILLTKADSVPDPIAAELRRLKPRKVVIFGGTATIQPNVEAALAGISGAPVERWSGPDRFSTSAQISQNTYAAGVDTVYVASGRVFTDALSGAPVAGKTDGPVLLVDTNAVPASIASELRRLAPRRIVIFGGTSTITPAVEATLHTYAGSVERWSGPDRFTTSTAITSQSYAAGVATVYIASGRVYTDALSGAPVAGMTAGPVLLVDTTKLPDTVATELARLKPKRIVVLGGQNTISYDVQAALAPYVTG